MKKPTDCKVFGTVCTPENPIGSCMVCSEGACAAHYTYGRFKEHRGPGRMDRSGPPMTKMRSDYVRPVDFKHGRVDMTHGGGGRAMAQLIEELFARAFDNEWLAQGNDHALLRRAGAAAW